MNTGDDLLVSSTISGGERPKIGVWAGVRPPIDVQSSRMPVSYMLHKRLKGWEQEILAKLDKRPHRYRLGSRSSKSPTKD